MRRTSKTPSLRTGAHAGVAIRNTPTRRTSCSLHGRGSTLPMRCGIGKTGGAEPPPLCKFINFFCRAAPMCAAAETHRTICYAPVGDGDCPPSCQPIPVHCRGRQSGHFLETGSLLPPPAALRRFPRRPADMHRTPCPASVGRGAHTPPLAAHRTTKPCHCEERSDVAIRTPFAPHLQPMRRGGVLPRPICRTLPVISCRAAPMCAAADDCRTHNGGAHWPRPTGFS